MDSNEDGISPSKVSNPINSSACSSNWSPKKIPKHLLTKLV
jgi:hypothetical protein